MTTQVLDYSDARPSPAAIKSAGYVGVLRYIAPAADAHKVIFLPEYQALLKAGLKVVLNWESYATRPREGAAAGTSDAQEALKQAKALGYTGAIYFSADYDAPASDQPALDAYFHACAQVLGRQRLGAYAGYWPLKRLFDAGLITFGWQTLAWSGGLREGRAHLFQTGAHAFNGGADVNDVLKSNWTGEPMATPHTTVPTGWHDDGKTLTAPNGIAVGPEFRAFILAGSWDANDVPLAPPEEGLAHIELGYPGKSGSRQFFLYHELGFNQATKAAYKVSVGREAYLAMHAATTPPTPAPAPDPVLQTEIDAVKAWLAAAPKL